MRRIFYYLLGILAALVLLGIIFNLITSRTQFRITGLSTSNQDFVSPFEPVVVAFNKEVTPEFMDSCTPTLTPNLELQKEAQQNLLLLIPAPQFAFGQVYQLQLTCDNLPTLSLTLRARTEDILSQEDIGRLQTIKDFETAQALEKVFTDQPWRTAFPVIEDNFDLVYSQTEDKYFGYYKIPPNSGLTKAAVETEAQEKLDSLQAPEKEIVWQ